MVVSAMNNKFMIVVSAKLCQMKVTLIQAVKLRAHWMATLKKLFTFTYRLCLPVHEGSGSLNSPLGWQVTTGFPTRLEPLLQENSTTEQAAPGIPPMTSLKPL